MTIYYTYCSYETDKGLKGMLYIGYRKCPGNKTPETDNYFGSQTSKKNQDFKNNPNKDKVILGVFDNREEAIAHEIELHNLHDVARNPGFANQAKQTSKGFSQAGLTGEKSFWFGKKRDSATCQKISDSKKGKKGRKQSPETREKLARINKGREFSPEARQKMSKAKKGKKLNPEHCQKISDNHARLSGEDHPRSGKGWEQAGEKNPRFDHTLYNFENKELGIVEMQVTKYFLRNKYGLVSSNLANMIRGKFRQTKGWTLLQSESQITKES